MAKVTYKPDAKAGCPDETEQFGYAFVAGEAVEVADAGHLAKFAGHPFFDVADGGTGDDKPENDPNALRARHNGGGRFIIVRGDKDEKVKDGLTKAGADAFNALSAADKEAYVAD